MSIFYLDLRKVYEKMGGVFRTQSDTEVIPVGYKIKGEKVCNDLSGLFAFAIWDKLEKILFLARDWVGKKPLFRYKNSREFNFVFRDTPSWTDKLSTPSLSLYECPGSFPCERTIYAQAHSLLQTHWAIVRSDNNTPTIQHCWQMDFPQKSNQHYADLQQEYGAVLTDAIAIRLCFDVPDALTFSGATDSGKVAALRARRLNVNLKAFTIDYHTEINQRPEVLTAQKVVRFDHQPVCDAWQGYRKQGVSFSAFAGTI